MSNEVSNQNNNSMLSGLGGSLAFSGIMTGGFGSLSAVKRYGKKATKITALNNAQIKRFLEKNNSAQDVFTKNLSAAKNYENLSQARKQAAKLNKITNKKDGMTFFQKIKKVFTKKDYAALNKQDLDTAKDNLKDIKNNLKKGIDTTGISTQSFSKNLTSTFTKELKDPMGIFFSVTEAFSRFTSEAIPAFENEGVVAGLKATGKAVAAGVANFFADVGLSVAFRTAGTAIGGFFGPLGASIGSIVGNTVGGFLSNKIIQKIFPTKTPEDKIAQNDEQTQEIAQTQETTQTQEIAQTQEDTSAKVKDYSNMPTKEQVRQMAYSQAFPKTASKMNGYYA